MRLLVAFLAMACLVSAYKQKNPLKTKKYKCIELAEDEEIRIVSKSRGVRTYSRENFESEEPVESVQPMRNAQKARLPPPSPASSETIEVPQAHNRFNSERIMPATTMPPPPPDYPKDFKRDKQGRPLVLSPEHCAQVKKYARMYGVSDVMAWVKGNCRMAQMFVPGATCEDINELVASCYRNKFL